MNFESLYKKIKKIDENNLPGEDSQFKMVPSIRPRISREEINKTNPTLASVMLLVYPDEVGNCNFVLIQRKEYNGAHSAQISLPGGKLEMGESSIDAALRETYEEIGVKPDGIEIIASLTNVWVSPSKFLVSPYIGVLKEKPLFVKDSYEVDEILEVGIKEFFDDSCIVEEMVNSSYVKDLIVPAFRLNGKIVWGATAMILNEFRDAILHLE
ncbi:MAG: CoA pyrophosphatase [Flavobacteriales bacterium]|nr:CoA pyrophosphatase [Flavobacteriales bacterium]